MREWFRWACFVAVFHRVRNDCAVAERDRLFDRAGRFLQGPRRLGCSGAVFAAAAGADREVQEVGRSVG